MDQFVHCRTWLDRFPACHATCSLSPLYPTGCPMPLTYTNTTITAQQSAPHVAASIISSMCLHANATVSILLTTSSGSLQHILLQHQPHFNLPTTSNNGLKPLIYTHKQTNKQATYNTWILTSELDYIKWYRMDYQAQSHAVGSGPHLLDKTQQVSPC